MPSTLHRAAFFLALTSSVAHAGDSVCAVGTRDVDGAALSCTYTDLQTAVNTAQGADLTVYGLLSGATITGPASLLGAPSQGRTRAELDGGLVINCQCSVTIDDFLLDNGGTAALLDVLSGASLTVRDSVLQDATRGRGVLGSAAKVSGTLILEDVHIEGLSGGDTDSPIEVESGAFTMTRGSSLDTAGVDGGLLAAANSTVSINGANLSGGTTGGSGGLLHLLNSPTSIFGGAMLRDSSAGVRGGLVYASNSVLTLTDSTFARGTAQGGGGITLLSTGARSTAQRCDFIGNDATMFNGGAVDLQGSVLQFSDSTMVANTSTSGGVIGLWSSVLTLQDSLFAHNVANNGGVLNGGGTQQVDILDNVFFENTGTGAGGALVLSTQMPSYVSGNLFQGNTAPLGGAVYIDSDDGSDTVTEGNLFCANTATTSGGAVYTAFGTGSIALTNDVFIGNDAPEGGAMSITYESDVTLDHLTLLGNGASTTAQSGGGIYVKDTGSSALLWDSLVAHTLAGNGAVGAASTSLDLVNSVFGDNVSLDWSGTATPDNSTIGNASTLAYAAAVDCSVENWVPTIASPLADTASDGTDVGATGGLSPFLPSDVPTAPSDSDNDGWPDDVDCEPNDSTSYPGASEVCDGGVDNDCDGLADDDDLEGALGMVNSYADADGDGYTTSTSRLTCAPSTVGTPGDCDDSDPDNFPGNPEVCDGQDNDCDNLVDDADTALSNANTYYTDGDGDGAGDPSQPVYACTSSLPTTGTDCDDGDGDNFPGNTEVCDGQDNDCDNLIDDADSDRVGGTTHYTDADQDGHGDPDASFLACDSNAPTTGTDCDDDDELNYPGNVEACDGQDNDCDDLIDDADDVVSDATVWVTDGDGDGFGGEGGDNKRACYGGDGWAEAVGDCDDEAADIYPGADETCDGRDEDCDNSIDEAATDATDFYADVDGDGYGDDDTLQTSCAALDLVTQGGDCDPNDATVHPGAAETADDGVDQDCDGTDLTDLDGDGFSVPDDCNDTNSAVHPLATDIPNDGIDQDCSDEEAVSMIGGTSCSTSPTLPWGGWFLVVLAVRRRRRAS